MRRRVEAREVRFPLREAFRISRDEVTELALIEAAIEAEGMVGRGECRPYARYGETPASVMTEIEKQRRLVEAGGGRHDLIEAVPAGAARNALDCALWDLEAKQTGTPAWRLAGLAPPEPVLVTYTLSLDEPARMAEAARRVGRPLLKLKLGGEGDLERVEAVRAAVPEARLIVDANEAWTLALLGRFHEPMAALGVEMIEQPLPAGEDGALDGAARPVPLCADESCHTAADLDRLVGRYDQVNIKLDKAGGLTAALALLESAEARGFAVMVGCMMASSLAMAPAFMLAGRARFVDLDAPLLLARDRDPAIVYEGAVMQPPPPELWG